MENKIRARIAREFVSDRPTEVRSQLLRYLESAEEHHYSKQVERQAEAHQQLQSRVEASPSDTRAQRDLLTSTRLLGQAKALRKQATEKKYGSERQRIFGGVSFQWFWEDKAPPTV